MEKYEFSNKCIYRDAETGHLYRLNKKSKNNKPDYFVCHFKNCKARLTVLGTIKKVSGNHEHSNEDTNQEFLNIQFDKNLCELLSSVDIRYLSNNEIYGSLVVMVPGGHFNDEHRRKKIQIIKSHRSNMKKCKCLFNACKVQ